MLILKGKHVSKNNQLESIRLRWPVTLGAAILVLAMFVSLVPNSFAIGARTYVSTKYGPGEFVLSASGKSAPLVVSAEDYWGVVHATKDLQSDIAKVTGTRPELSTKTLPKSNGIVVAGTIGRSPLIDELIQKKKIDATGIKGKWESFIIETVERPFPGIDQALVIAGSDKRGTIYGIYDVSEKIGVSPWYWWADVPPRHHGSLYVKTGTFEEGPPSVRYRGIFLNDEWPDLTDWVIHRYGFAKTSMHPPVPPGVANYGHRFYERVFDLLLRLKANYLWPAMWNNAFNEDDTLNPVMANKYGIVMGSSHQEPMIRAQKEWDRRYFRTLGPWNFAKFPDTLIHFWRRGIERNRNFESIVTIGLRGENDTPMIPGGTLTQDTTLLGKIVRVQEKILAQDMNPDVAEIPQLWCPYKEVLSYYDAGFRVPDYVTILWTDDNYGNLRRLPDAAESERPGGAGIYYHFDYHGGPRNYQWINTNALPKIWDQMSLAKEYGADRIWIVNVGHLKGYELPISYFMDLAWNTNRWTNSNIGEYARMWARQQFGKKYADRIAHILLMYSKYNSRRKPELLRPTTYSVVNYNEAARVVSSFKKITDEAQNLYKQIPTDDKKAFYEIVLFPTKASYILNDMYYAAGRNELYAAQGRATTDEMAARTRDLFAADTSLMGYFNHTFDQGKWDHFMDQPFIGYTGWNQPRENNLDAVDLKEINAPDAASMGVAVEGYEQAWPGPSADPVLPGFDPFNEARHYIDIFDKGKTPFTFTATSDKPWIGISQSRGEVRGQKRIWVNVNWKRAPKGNSTGTVKITGTDENVSIIVKAVNPTAVTRSTLKGFVEEDGYVSIEAAHYSRLIDAGANRWINIQGYGNTLSGMRAVSPVNASPAVPGKNSPCLEYKIFLLDTGKVDVEGIFSPTLNFQPGRGLQYAVSFDGAPPHTVTLVPADFVAGFGKDWGETVSDNVRKSFTSFHISKPGYHVLKIWMVDPGAVLEKIVVNAGGVKDSYLGPPESFHRDVMNDK